MLPDGEWSRLDSRGGNKKSHPGTKEQNRKILPDEGNLLVRFFIFLDIWIFIGN
jgi:hypothetical protein